MERQMTRMLSQIASKIGGKEAAALLRTSRTEAKEQLDLAGYPSDENVQYENLVEKLFQEKLDSLKELKNYW